MGANAQTSVPTFTAGEVLTAANMNISARTGIPVFADATARDAAFGGTGEKTLAEGQFAYLESTNATQYYDGSAWQPVAGSSGLTLVSTTTIGTTVSSVTVSSAFSATYDNYKIIVSGGVGSTNAVLALSFPSNTTDYYYGSYGIGWTGGTTSNQGNNTSNFGIFGYMTANTLYGNCEIFNPFATKNTLFFAPLIAPVTNGNGQYAIGFLNNSNSISSFTITPASGTLTGGTIRVYGYQNS